MADTVHTDLKNRIPHKQVTLLLITRLGSAEADYTSD